MVRIATCPNMGSHGQSTILPSSEVSLIQAIAVHVRGKRRVQERFEILPQELPPDGMTVVLPFTEVKVSQDEHGLLLLIENFHQAGYEILIFGLFGSVDIDNHHLL